MKIRTRLTILFMVITASILLAFAAIIYYTARESREKEFYALLKKEAVTKANLFFNANVDKKTLQSIYHNNRKILNEVEVAIYNTSFRLLYHDAVDIDFVKETPAMLNDIRQKSEIGFYQEKWQVIGITYRYQHQDYLITAAAYDQYGYNKLDNLLSTITGVSFFSVLVLAVSGWYFSRKVLQPVSEMAEQVRHISATNLDLRVPDRASKDELSELANIFNSMLSRLEHSFDAQKNFVSNISHELRTPLSAIIGELELSAIKERSVEEYKTVIQNALKDAQKLSRLSGSMLDFAKASYDASEISFKPVRIDEIILDARQQVLRTNPLYKIDIHFKNESDDENQISVTGNEYLLTVAFSNLFENGCKFSADHKSTLAISFGAKDIMLEFQDAGVGISTSDLPHIFTPFYRGENKSFTSGNGIGLPLTQKIIHLHAGSLNVYSVKNFGTTFTVMLPHL